MKNRLRIWLLMLLEWLADRISPPAPPQIQPLTIDLAKVSSTVTNVAAMANVGAQAVATIAGLVANIRAVCAQHGYDVDTQRLTEVIVDAEARRQRRLQEAGQGGTP